MYNIFNKVNILLYWKLIVIIIFLISLFLFISLFSYIYTAIWKIIFLIYKHLHVFKKFKNIRDIFLWILLILTLKNKN